MVTESKVRPGREEGKTIAPTRPNRALRRLARLVGTWKIVGRTLDSKRDNIAGRVSCEWLPGGFFMIQRGEIHLGHFKTRSLEIIGYDSLTRTFPSYVYSDLGGVPLEYHWDVRGDVVKHWTDGSSYTGRFSEDGKRLSGGWRPKKGKKRTPGNTYDATMFRIK